MPSPTDIANLALQYLGESPIIDIQATGDKVSRTCAIAYGQAVDEALATAPWACAKKQLPLSRLAQAPLYKWAAAYQLPGDFIRLVEIEGADAWHPSEHFDRMGSTLVLGAAGHDEAMDTIHIEYVFRQPDTTAFEPLLVECAAVLMGVKMARILTGSDEKGEKMRETYERVLLPRAMTIGAQQIYSGKNHPLRQMLRTSLLLNARH